MSKKKLTAKIQIPKSNNGITLIALIITIVVMLILVAVTLSIALGENGVINTAKEAKEKTEMSTEKEKLQDAVFATAGSNGEVNIENIVLPEGFTEISKDENKTIYQGPSGQQYEVDNITGEIIEIEGVEDLEITTDTQGVTFTKSDGITPGDPNNLKNGDRVTYGDYKYTYNSKDQGWSVAVLDKTKEEYGEIATAIYGKPITSLFDTFRKCTNMRVAPEIPNCVTSMGYTFYYCESLIEAPEIPSGVTNMKYTFSQCKALTTASKIPESITDMTQTFYYCESLIEAPEIPSGVTNMSKTFYKCKSLTTVPSIPKSVTNMGETFNGCYKLTEISEIPESVTNMNYTFNACLKLQGEIIINAIPTTYTGCFASDAGTKGTGIVLKGSSTVLNELAATDTLGNVTVAK